jgi:hypothetical protein
VVARGRFATRGSDRLRGLALCLVLLHGGLHAAEPVGLYLANIPVSAAPAPGGDPAGSAFGEFTRLEIEVSAGPQSAAYLEASGLPFQELAANRFAVWVPARATLAAPPAARDRAASFVIDFDQAPVQALLGELAVPADGAELEGLVEFVHASITSKNYQRGFDIASEVARRRAGDCTEHAVLMTALARARGWSARVVTGTLLVEAEGSLGAFGHAWTEVFADRAWRIVDATRPLTWLPAGAALRYLPQTVFADEGPGFALGLFATAQVLPVAIANVAPAAAATLPVMPGCRCEAPAE